MSFLLTSDVHMNLNPRDAYRWGLFEWLAKTGEKLDVDEFIILGDFTDAKDRHAAQLVNKFVDGIRKLSEIGSVHLLKANHDYVDEGWPFFGFTGAFNNVSFYAEPTDIDLMGCNEVLFLPSTRNYEEEWKELDFKGFDYIFCHQTFEGAIGENGFKLSGIPPEVFRATQAKIYSGDIHAPGFAGKVEYVGAPYHTSFGCNYTPRVVYVDDNDNRRDLRFPCPSRYTLDIHTLKDLNRYKKIAINDQVKVRVHLDRADLPLYQKICDELRRELDKRQWELCGIESVVSAKLAAAKTPEQGEHRTPEQLVRDFAEKNDLTKEQEELGISLLA